MLQPDISQLLIRTTLPVRIFIVTIERGGICKIDNNLAGTVHQNGIPISPDIRTLHLNLGAETHTPVGVIGETILPSPIVGQRVIGNIAFVNEHLAFFRTHLILQLTGKPNSGTDTFRIVCCNADDNARIRVRGKILCGLSVSTSLIGCMSRSIADIQPTAVACNRRFRIQIIYGKLAQRLVVLTEMPLNITLQLVGFLIITLT